MQVYFYTQVTLNIAKDEEMLALFHAAGFRRFFIGIETADVVKLRAMEKVQNAEVDIPEAIARIQAHNITVWAGIILGLDGDDASTFDEQYRFIDETAITPTLIGILQAMPGAPLYDRIKREGRLRVLPSLVGSNSMGSLAAQGTTNIVPKDISLPSLMNGFGAFVRRVFAPDAYTDRLLRATARATREPPSVVGALNWKVTKIIGRTVQWYVRHSDPEVRRMLPRVLSAALRRRGAGLEELIYHLVIYKHLRAFYFETADVTERAASALTTPPSVETRLGGEAAA